MAQGIALAWLASIVAAVMIKARTSWAATGTPFYLVPSAIALVGLWPGGPWASSRPETAWQRADFTIVRRQRVQTACFLGSPEAVMMTSGCRLG